jgi:hypothetical protein
MSELRSAKQHNQRWFERSDVEKWSFNSFNASTVSGVWHGKFLTGLGGQDDAEVMTCELFQAKSNSGINISDNMEGYRKRENIIFPLFCRVKELIAQMRPKWSKWA